MFVRRGHWFGYVSVGGFSDPQSYCQFG